MYSSIYNDNRFDTKKLFFKNLIKLYHFSSTVRTPPNKYTNNFIGELKSRKNLHFDIFLPRTIKTCSSTLYNEKNNNSVRRILNKKSPDLPKLIINNNVIKNSINSKNNNFLISNQIINNGAELGIIDLNFPYCKPKLKYSKSNVILNQRFKYKNKGLNTINTDKVNLKKPHRLFMKSLSNFQQIIKKSKKIKI